MYVHLRAISFLSLSIAWSGLISECLGRIISNAV